ncbi:MAG: HAD family hydrolase [Nocardioidaceae bacterium]
MTSRQPVVTFDLFSALLDSRRGGAAAFAEIGRARGWPVDGETVYDDWDMRNKAAQRDCDGWVPYAALAAKALTATYSALDLRGTAARDTGALIRSMTDWPLWPDVACTLPEWVAAGGKVAGHRIGLLSNVDDHILGGTRAASLVDHTLAMTSQRLQVYKPDPRIYTRAADRLAAIVHVASSARDVRGALEAGCTTVRLRRPGHDIDPEGPHPAYEVDDVRDLVDVLTEMPRG